MKNEYSEKIKYDERIKYNKIDVLNGDIEKYSYVNKKFIIQENTEINNFKNKIDNKFKLTKGGKMQDNTKFIPINAEFLKNNNKITIQEVDSFIKTIVQPITDIYSINRAIRIMLAFDIRSLIYMSPEVNKIIQDRITEIYKNGLLKMKEYSYYERILDILSGKFESYLSDAMKEYSYYERILDIF
jgi:hypothetical protein